MSPAQAKQRIESELLFVNQTLTALAYRGEYGERYVFNNGKKSALLGILPLVYRLADSLEKLEDLPMTQEPIEILMLSDNSR